MSAPPPRHSTSSARFTPALEAAALCARGELQLSTHDAGGDVETAAMEIAAARTAFERLGTVLDAARAVEAEAELTTSHASERAPTRDAHVHVHGHRRVDAADRGHRRRGVGGTRAVA